MTMTDGGEGAFTQATGRGLEDATGEHQRRYRAFQFGLISQHCGSSVLEVGAGLGEFASQFHGLDRLVVTDLDPGAVEQMAKRFAGRPEVDARQLDLSAPQPAIEPVASVVAVNVLEHIEDDSEALRSLARLVAPGGNIVLWVPGYMQLYGEFDRLVGHVRRYTPATLRAAILTAGLSCAEARPVNMLGAMAWWLAVRRGGVEKPNPKLVGIYDKYVVPVTKTVEARVRPPFGQSVLAVATVPR
jgi:SAM-dependent methyltransferase